MTAIPGSIRSAAVAAVLAVAASGCSTTPKVTNVSEVHGPVIEGVPFRIKTNHVVRIWALQEDDTYKEVSVSQAHAVDMSRLFAIDARSYPFASPSLRVSLNPDNTLKAVTLKSTNNTAQGLEAISSAAAGVTKAQTDKAAARVAASTAIASAEKSVRDAQDAFDKLTNPSEVTRAAHLRAIDAARRQANEAYAAAGLPRPYPEP